MNVRAQWIAVLLIGLLLGAGAACSSTSEDDDGAPQRDGGGDGDGDTGDGDGDTGDGDGDTGDGDGDNGDGDNGDGDTGDDDGGTVQGIPCGAEVCQEGGCCADPFQSLCGAAVGERGCIKPPEPDENSDPRCPEIGIPGFFNLPSCCTPEGMCGVNAMGLGAPTDCTELGMFKMAVEERTGGMAPFNIPAPKSCD